MSYASHNQSYSMPSMLERNVLSGVAQLYSGSVSSVFYKSPGANISQSISSVSKEFYSNMRMSEKGEGYILDLDSRIVEFIPQYVGNSRSSAVEKYKKKGDYFISSASGSAYHLLAPDSYRNIITAGLLSDSRPLTQFIDDAKDVEEFVREAFEKVVKKPFPDDISVRVCSEEELIKAHTAHGGIWNPGIQGFAINKMGDRRIFVKKNNLDALMLVLGHEIGHVITLALNNSIDEEAKAFAFELAWVKAIIKHDIAGLKHSFNVDFMPANNGIHNIAFSFVQSLVKTGKDALSVYWDLVKKAVSAVPQPKS